MARVDPADIDPLSPKRYEGPGFRQQAPEFDPFSGEGARRRGGRFNPPDSFPVLYLCSTRACAVAEFYRTGSQLAIGPEGLLPRHLFRYSLRLDRVLDLGDRRTIARLDITNEDLVGEDLSITRRIGQSVQALGLEALRSPSATGQDDVLAIFIENIASGAVDVKLLEIWESVTDVARSR